MMNIRADIVEQFSSALSAVGPDVPLLLAAYVTGDYFIGRPLWNSPVEVVLVADIPPQAGTFARQRAPFLDADIQKIQHALARVDYRIQLDQCRLDEDNGQFVLFQARYVPQLLYYHAAMAIIKGQRVYAAPDFMLDKFEEDTRQAWLENEKPL